MINALRMDDNLNQRSNNTPEVSLCGVAKSRLRLRV